MLEWVAAIHVHSRYSDGSGEIPDILSAAREAGLDVVVSTDHDTLSVRREGWEGWHAGVLLVAGAEVTPCLRPHCVALGVRHCCGYSQMSEPEMLAAIQAQGGFAVVAHPQGLHRRSLRILHKAWTHWRHPAVRAFELWSYMHDWIEDLHGWRILKAYDFWRHPHKMIKGPRRRLLEIWDHVARTRRLSAISGLDCHARHVDLLNVVLFPYRQMFETVRTHLFVDRRAGDLSDAGRALEAAAEGRSFVAYDGLCDARGTWAEAETASGRTLRMGEEHTFNGLTRLRIMLPRAAEIRLIADGRCCMQRSAMEAEFVARGPGVYRFEVHLAGKPWIFANPFYLRQHAAPA